VSMIRMRVPSTVLSWKRLPFNLVFLDMPTLPRTVPVHNRDENREVWDIAHWCFADNLCVCGRLRFILYVSGGCEGDAVAVTTLRLRAPGYSSVKPTV
jgi:hypothetical protein